MGGLYYPNQSIEVLIGSKSGTTRTSVEMESTYQTTESPTEATKSFECGGYSNVVFDVLYTMGTSETSNSIEIKLESSTDRTNWTRLPTDTTTGGTSTLAAREFTFVGTDGAAATTQIKLDVNYKFMRISCKETGVAANKGSVYVEATLGGR